MDKNKKLKIALPILGVIMAFVYGPLIFGSGSKDKADNNISHVNKNTQVSAGMLDLAALPGTGGREKAKTVYMQWGQNPFMFKRAPKVLNLEGIMWDKKNPKAIINGDIFGIGETVESKIIVDIRPSSVIIKGDDGKEIELKY